MQVARLVSLGLTNRQIAASLSLSACTVRNMLSAIYDRVGQSGRAYLATLLAEGRLVADSGAGQREVLTRAATAPAPIAASTHAKAVAPRTPAQPTIGL